MHSYTPLFTDKPAYNSLTRYTVTGVVVLTLIIGLVLIPFDIMGTWLMLGVSAFEALIFRCILPQRFEVYEERLKIKLGGPFSINIFYPDLISVKETDKESMYVFLGLKLATSNRYVVEIERKNGMNIVISPSQEEEFINQVKRAKAAYREPDFDKLFEEKLKGMR